MKILVVRHAIAMDREEFAKTGADDARRPLTRTGRRRMKRGAAGLVRIVSRLDVLVSSPLIRAVQTAEIIAEAYGGLRTTQIAPLSPRKPVTAILHWLRSQPSDATVALVGHEPQLGIFVSWMLTGLQESFTPLKKSAACLLEVDQDVQAGRAKLVWSLRPSHLRRLGKC